MLASLVVVGAGMSAQPAWARDGRLPDRLPSHLTAAVGTGVMAPRHVADTDRPTFSSELRQLFNQPHGGAPNLRLSDDDADRYRRIFALQDDGEWEGADTLVAGLDDRRLMGHVDKQRLLHPQGRKASYDELVAWLSRHADHAGADRVHQLALKRQRPGDKTPPAPEDAERLTGVRDTSARAPVTVVPRGRSGADRAQVAQAVNRIDEELRAGKPSKALALLDNDRFARQIDLLEYDALRTRVAAGFFGENKPGAALTLAAAAAARSGDSLPVAHWYAGLSSWRLGRFEQAARHFQAVAGHTRATPGEAAAGAYWAARAERRLGHADRARGWMETAARHPRTFYGLIATRAVGREPDFRWEVPPLTSRHLAALGRQAAGYRAIALLQIGQNELAEAELSRIHPQDDAVLREALVAIADRAGLAGLSLRLGNALAGPEGETWDAALYPLPHWRPESGFAVDRALLFAFMRQESRFNATAKSRAGARGLMQIMPATASTVAEGDEPADFTGSDRARLNDPQVSLTLGQRYLTYLLDLPDVGGGLFQLAAAYNAGPGANARWTRSIAAGDDPLLFVESIPFRETREFVRKVATNYWIYQSRLGQVPSTLDSVATGRWPVYSPADGSTMQVADDRMTDDQRADGAE